jgi:lipid-binding SYLF domain-containing protein
MKRIGILFGSLLLGACMVWAQDNSANSSTNNDTTATQQDNSSMTDKQTDDAHKKAAMKDENAADAQKDAAKAADTKEGEEYHKVMARLDDAAKDVNQLLAAPDDGIPESVFGKAKCVAVVPSMIKGGFIVGAEHGRGVASCRLPDGSWSAPAFFVVTGGNWGAQIGAQAVDLTMLVMNENGMNQLLSSKWKLGADASVSAGPLGRTAAADTNLKFNSEVLTYSRSRGAYIGAVLNGANIKADEDSMRAYYGRTVGFRPVLTGQVKDAHANDVFVSTLHKSHNEVNATAH